MQHYDFGYGSAIWSAYTLFGTPHRIGCFCGFSLSCLLTVLLIGRPDPRGLATDDFGRYVSVSVGRWSFVLWRTASVPILQHYSNQMTVNHLELIYRDTFTYYALQNAALSNWQNLGVQLRPEIWLKPVPLLPSLHSCLLPPLPSLSTPPSINQSINQFIRRQRKLEMIIKCNSISLSTRTPRYGVYTIRCPDSSQRTYAIQQYNTVYKIKNNENIALQYNNVNTIRARQGNSFLSLSSFICPSFPFPLLPALTLPSSPSPPFLSPPQCR